MTFNIDGLIKKINMMKDGNEKKRLYDMLLAYILHYNNQNPLNPYDINLIDKQINDIEQFDKMNITRRNYACNELYRDIDLYNILYKSILHNANHYSLVPYYYPNVNYEELIIYVEAFFKYLDSDLYNLYLNHKNNNFIIETTYRDTGGCFNINGNYSSIILNNTNSLTKAIALVHEIGHAYDNYLNRNQNVKTTLALNVEATPLVLEKLFIRFLDYFHLLNSKTIEICEQRHHIDNLIFTNCAYIYNKLVLQGEIPLDIILNIDYNLNIPKEMYEKYSLILENTMEYSKQYINLYANLYGMAYLISNTLINKSKTIKEVILRTKEYSMLTKSLNNSEILELFTKEDYLNATNKFVNKTLTKKAPTGAK